MSGSAEASDPLPATGAMRERSRFFNGGGPVLGSPGAASDQRSVSSSNRSAAKLYSRKYAKLSATVNNTVTATAS